MMRSGKTQDHNKSGPVETSKPIEPGIIIFAEIAFAALLLYLTNHPLELNDLTQAQESTEKPVIEQIKIPGEIETPTPAQGVTVAATNIIVQEPLLK